MNTMSKRANGFTLIELLIVVVIIGILAAIAIPKFGAVRERAYLAAARADLRNLANLQDVYYNDNYTYTTDLVALGYTATEGVNLSVIEAANTGWSAYATHSGIPSESCAIFHGSASPLAPATVLSTVQCSR